MGERERCEEVREGEWVVRGAQVGGLERGE